MESAARADGDLVREAQRGDPSAFEELVRRHARPVYLSIYMESANRADAEDLTQETFLLAHRRLPQLREPDRFGAWCRSIARSAAVDAARRRGRRKRTPPEMREAPVSTDAPDRSAALREQKEEVLTAVRGLPEEYRLPILMRYMDDLSYEEMAERLRVSHGALRGTLHRGMTLLRSRLGALAPAAARAEPRARTQAGQG